jgi:hypothetical protein
MTVRRLVVVLFVTTSLCACNGSSDDIDSYNYPGPKGEPPRGLPKIYEKQFVAEQRNYFKAVGEIHAFALEHGLYPGFGKCLSDVIDIRVTADTVAHKRAFPCRLISAWTGEPPVVYLTVTVNDVMFNQLDGNNRLILTVNIYGSEKEGGLKDFRSMVEPALIKLYTSKPHSNESAPQPIIPPDLREKPRRPVNSDVRDHATRTWAFLRGSRPVMAFRANWPRSL